MPFLRSPAYSRAMPTLPLHAGPLTHSPFFVALLFVFVTALALNTSRHRLRTHVIFGDGGDEPLRRANRAHGNAIEHVTVIAILLVLLELQGVDKAWIVAVGTAALTARAACRGVHREDPPHRPGRRRDHLLARIAPQLLGGRERPSLGTR